MHVVFSLKLQGLSAWSKCQLSLGDLHRIHKQRLLSYLVPNAYHCNSFVTLFSNLRVSSKHYHKPNQWLNGLVCLLSVFHSVRIDCGRLQINGTAILKTETEFLRKIASCGSKTTLA